MLLGEEGELNQGGEMCVVLFLPVSVHGQRVPNHSARAAAEAGPRLHQQPAGRRRAKGRNTHDASTPFLPGKLGFKLLQYSVFFELISL